VADKSPRATGGAHDQGGARRDTATPSPQLHRRRFVQVGLAAAAGTLVPGADVASSPRPPAPGAVAQPGQRRGRVAAAPSDLPPAVSSTSPETWTEPWVWRASDWPGQQLDLNVVENENPGPAVRFGNPNAVLFSYGGNTPGPTIRTRGDETLHVKLRNLLGRDFGETFVGPYPATAGLPSGVSVETVKAAAEALGNKRADFCVGEHTNGVHSVRVTNLHTHGLHVRPSRNPNGTHSDNVILRVLSQPDYRRREAEASTAPCAFLRDPDTISFLLDDEQAGEADYEFRLGNVQREQHDRENTRRAREGLQPLPPQSHPAGTFWYHPHAHGATHNQVASGMAGFLIVEGDVDDAVNQALAGEPRPDPEIKTGAYDYRERLMFFQRVLAANRSVDPDAPNAEQTQRVGATPLTNGDADPATIRMRPGSVERWRALNGSVDGRGYKRLMVVRGQYVVRNRQLFEVGPAAGVTAPGGAAGTGGIDDATPITLADLEALEARKQPLWQLSIDGVTLVVGTSDAARYTIKDLSEQHRGTRNPLWDPDPDCPPSLAANQPYGDTLCRLRNVWKTPENVRHCYVRPNEFYMGPANRTDLFFRAPSDLGQTDPASGDRFEVYTVLAKAVLVHSDTPVQSNQVKVANPAASVPPSPEDVVIAHVVVTGDPVPGAGDPVRDRALPALQRVPVQDYLLPIDDRELRVTESEVEARDDVSAGDARTRRVVYSGWGNADLPLLSTYPADPSAANFAAFIAADQAKPAARNGRGPLENLVYARNGVDANGRPYYVLLPANLRTMAIKFDNPDPIDPSHPGHPRKFDPSDPNRARMLVDTAEEWALYNASDLLWGNTTATRKAPTDAVDEDNDPTARGFRQPPTQFQGHYPSYSLSRAEGDGYFDRNPDFQVVTKAIDHPFHVHQNPFWVTRIEIPDQHGDLVNILDEPRWMDTIWIPRHRGRVVFRSRYPDFVGAYVHHCHILLHEDNGMMHVVEATPFVDESNYRASRQVAPSTLPDTETAYEQVGEIYPRPTADEAYVDSMRFVDPDPSTGQVYPGFDVVPPKLT
jgi:FtsP/CotA-like multicopper oxidase with cupredoxin domain